ncbi:MAG TPA: M15 family metallopeptidase [Candidatus Deferrimicrobiaceae bacterium]|nr:M15 family metallopeptidase [Candidatus Deferrimicrobiaceae bacterium]
MPFPSRRRGLPLRLAGCALALALVALVAAPAARTTFLPDDPAGAARAMGPLPACRYDDILTSPRGYGDWAVTLVDAILRVPRTYVPPNLVPVAEAGIEGSGKVRQVMVDDLRAMADAARAAGAALGVQSAYRSYDKQRKTFRGWVDRYGREQALKFSARPGHSEHQLGLAIDFRSESGGSPFEGDWGETKAGKWMAANAWQYGFVMSYPKGRQAVTCYEYESWHYRYVGRDLAEAIHDSGLTIREYLWAHYTTAVVPPPSGAPLPTYAPTATPDASPTPSESAAASPEASPSPTPSPSPSPSSSPTPSAEPSAAPFPPPTGGAAAISPDAAAIGLGVILVMVSAVALLARRGWFGAVP